MACRKNTKQSFIVIIIKVVWLYEKKMHIIVNRKMWIFYIQDNILCKMNTKKYLLNANFVPDPGLGIERKQWKKQIRHNLLGICI